ncbi:hypothetical protein ASF61_21380 [Duganella sp. Leaf126]|nr:hypothetical protein ASF61_21380 [Duganella sp. Leaf126]
MVLITAAATTVMAQQLPNDDVIAREAIKQAARSASTIEKADRQSRQLRQAVPDVGAVGPLPAPLPAPDPSDIAKRYGAAQQPQAALFVLVSLSMPPASLDRLAAQAGKAGATLVLRGVVDGSLTKTAEMTAAVIRQHPGAQFQIDPTLFRRFNVDQVPTFVLATPTARGQTCGKDCDAQGTFVRVSGDVTLDYALEHLARQANPRFARLAEQRLKQVRGTP